MSPDSLETPCRLEGFGEAALAASARSRLPTCSTAPTSQTCPSTRAADREAPSRMAAEGPKPGSRGAAGPGRLWDTPTWQLPSPTVRQVSAASHAPPYP